MPRCKENDEASGLLSLEQVQGAQFLLLSCFELYNTIFSNASGQMQVMLKKMAGLLAPPHLESNIRLHMCNQRTAMDAILSEPGLTTKEELARHIEALSAVSFVHLATQHQPLDADTRSVYQHIEEKLVILIKDLPSALTLKDLALILDELESILTTRGLLPSGTPKSSFNKTNLRQIADDKRGTGRGNGCGSIRGGRGGQRGGNGGKSWPRP